MIAAKLLLAMAGGVAAGAVKRQDSSVAASSTSTGPATTTVPDYFEITPRIFNGPTSSGVAPFLAETNPAPFSMATFVPNSPLETAIPISGNTNNDNIFHYMGNLSPYFPNTMGFGVDEMPLPGGANITWVNMLSRHGSRYPTSDSAPQSLGGLIANSTKNGTTFSGALSFLNTWQYKLGFEVLVPIGKQELFESGVLHYYQYGHLWNRSQPLVFRTTTEERMRQSAENFAAGFGGDINFLSQNIEIEYIIEEDYFNNTLAGYDNCNQSNADASDTGSTAASQWEKIYLADAVARFNNMSQGLTWTTSTVYAAQQLCPYETVSLGYSSFCDLFTFEEWEGFEYSIDLSFAGNDMFQSPTGRAVGIGYVQEVLARLNHHLLTETDTQANVTLDSMNSTFPLNQNLYFDFSHDTNIASIITAFNFTQFAPVLNQTAIDTTRMLVVSQMEKFGVRLDIEVIAAPYPVSANRTSTTTGSSVYDSDCTELEPTSYIHFILNQRTLPLYPGFPACGNRTDGWCELSTYLQAASGLLAAAEYDFSCNGNYSSVPYGTITNGVPLS